MSLYFRFNTWEPSGNIFDKSLIEAFNQTQRKRKLIIQFKEDKKIKVEDEQTEQTRNESYESFLVTNDKGKTTISDKFKGVLRNLWGKKFARGNRPSSDERSEFMRQHNIKMTSTNKDKLLHFCQNEVSKGKKATEYYEEVKARNLAILQEL